MNAALTLPQRPTALYMVAVLDVLVLLLVLFLMVVGAGQESGLLVTPPESEFRLQRYENRIVVTAMEGALFINRERVSPKSFATRLEEVAEEQNAEIVLLRADRNLSVGVERELIETAARMGLLVALVGQESGTSREPPLAEPGATPED